MVRPAELIVLNANQKQKLTSWARAATTPQRLARRARIIWAVPPDSVTAASAAGTDESDNCAALACSLRGWRV